MIASSDRIRPSPEAYLAWEAEQPIKYEYLNGEAQVQHPCFIVEVLSPGAEGDDRGEKFKQYRKISSLKEYGLVNTENMGVDIYRLNAAGKWELTPYFSEVENEATSLFVDFASVDFKCAIADIYEDMELFPEISLFKNRRRRTSTGVGPSSSGKIGDSLLIAHRQSMFELIF